MLRAPKVIDAPIGSRNRLSISKMMRGQSSNDKGEQRMGMPPPPLPPYLPVMMINGFVLVSSKIQEKHMDIFDCAHVSNEGAVSTSSRTAWGRGGIPPTVCTSVSVERSAMYSLV